jgi:hypothetical protein
MSDEITVSASGTFSAAALRLLADEIEFAGFSDTRYVPTQVGLVWDPAAEEWTALATLTAVVPALALIPAP